MSSTFHEKLKPRLILLLWASVLLVVAGCGHQQNTVSYNDLLSTSVNLLKGSIYLGEAVRMYPQTSQSCERWLADHTELIAAADLFYTQQQSRSGNIVVWNGQAVTADAIQLKHRALLQAQRRIEWAMKYRDTDWMCDHTTIPELQTAMSDQQSIMQLTLSTPHTPSARIPDNLPSMASTIPPALSPGRSYFRVEKLAIENYCKDAALLTLRNRWPTENYLIQCPDQARQVQCQWSTCETIEPADSLLD